MEVFDETVHKRRSQAEKVGKHKYEIELLHRIERRMEKLEKMFRIVFHGLEGYFQFDRPLIEEVGTQSEMDLGVVNVIFEAGSDGILARDIALKLPQYKLEQHKILRIIIRVNRNIENAFGRMIIEKRGKKWAFTDFGMKIWGETDREKVMEEDQDAS